jgi:protein-S-isoprenylcysteine O-methyltransferase Ste14
MRLFYDYFFPAIWAVFLLYWQVKAYGTKQTQRLEPISSRILRSVAFLCAIALLMVPHIPVPWLYWQFLPQGYWAFYGGAVLTTSGLAFAVWARGYLGTNWSRSVTIKQDHELIVGGPYALVRHPIYTGILTGFLGSAIALGQVRGIIAFLLVSLALWAKLRMEERWIREQFGASYDDYSQRVAALVPFIL